MGILNITPDSFYDGGSFYDNDAELRLEKACARGVAIEAEGAALIDIGGESSRPFSRDISEEEELARVIPVVKLLASRLSTPLSIDTKRASVAKKALESGASWINDITGFSNPAMVELAVGAPCRIILMHMQGRPATMQIAPHYPRGVVATLLEWFEERVESLIRAGVKEEAIVLDPGLGFGKSFEDNWAILQNLALFKELGLPILIGCSRKSFLGKSLSATLAVNIMAHMAGVEFLRIHDVKEHREALGVVAQMQEVATHSSCPL